MNLTPKFSLGALSRLASTRQILLAGALALGALASGCLHEPELARPPQVIVISVDALRADYLGPWRTEWGYTPHLDRLARESVVFMDALTSWPDTSAAHKSLFYGLYHHAHKTDFRRHPQEERLTSPVAILTANGLATAGYFSIGRIAQAIGLNRGFQVFDVRGQRVNVGGSDLPSLLRLASDWLSQHRREPFFLFLHLHVAPLE